MANSEKIEKNTPEFNFIVDAYNEYVEEHNKNLFSAPTDGWTSIIPLNFNDYDLSFLIKPESDNLVKFMKSLGLTEIGFTQIYCINCYRRFSQYQSDKYSLTVLKPEHVRSCVVHKVKLTASLFE